MERLDEILDNTSGPTPFSALDYLYRHILGTHKNTELLVRILTVVCCCSDVRYGVDPDTIEQILKLRGGTVTTVLRRMRSVLKMEQLIDFYHKSFRDFLHNKERAQEYFIDVKRGHALIAQMLLRSILLCVRPSHFDYCNLNTSV